MRNETESPSDMFPICVLLESMLSVSDSLSLSKLELLQIPILNRKVSLLFLFMLKLLCNFHLFNLSRCFNWLQWNSMGFLRALFRVFLIFYCETNCCYFSKLSVWRGNESFTKVKSRKFPGQISQLLFINLVNLANFDSIFHQQLSFEKKNVKLSYSSFYEQHNNLLVITIWITFLKMQKNDKTATYITKCLSAMIQFNW